VKNQWSIVTYFTDGPVGIYPTHKLRKHLKSIKSKAIKTNT
jgi:hypothetical protein